MGATWDEPPELRDDDCRAQSLYDLLQPRPGFVSALYLREEGTGRLMWLTSERRRQPSRT